MGGVAICGLIIKICGFVICGLVHLRSLRISESRVSHKICGFAYCKKNLLAQLCFIAKLQEVTNFPLLTKEGTDPRRPSEVWLGQSF
jgi:hypothetical protein